MELIADAGFTDMTRPGQARGTHEAIEHPSIVVYRHDPARDELIVLSIVHGAVAAEPRLPRGALVGWILFDPACQPFFTLVTTFVFAPYFAADPVAGGRPAC